MISADGAPIGRLDELTLAESTYNSCEATVRLHLKPALGRHRSTKLTADHVNAFITSKRPDQKPNRLRIMRSTQRGPPSAGERREPMLARLLRYAGLSRYRYPGDTLTPVPGRQS